MAPAKLARAPACRRQLTVIALDGTDGGEDGPRKSRARCGCPGGEVEVGRRNVERATLLGSACRPTAPVTSTQATLANVG
jgi:hypothetical protein